jgi:hypothetical protein
MLSSVSGNGRSDRTGRNPDGFSGKLCGQVCFRVNGFAPGDAVDIADRSM